MGRRKKLLIAVTNRSSYNKVKTIIKSLPKNVEPYLLLGNSVWLYKYGDVHNKIYEDFPHVGIYKVSMAVEGDDLIKMPKSVGVGCIEISTIIDNLKPDLMLTVADRYETLATATVASYCNVPLIHLQGGEVSGTIDNKVRHAITQLADWHFPATYKAMMKLQDVKFPVEENLFNYGCPSMDLMIGMRGMPMLRDCRIGGNPYNDYKDTHNEVMLKAFEEVDRHGHGDTMEACFPFIIIMLHPDTVNPISTEQIDNLMATINNNIPYQKLIFWNNIDPGGEIISKEIRFTESRFWRDKVRFIKHIEPEVFGALLYNCSLMIGNSSAGIREATFMGTPSISIGQRQEGREHGDNVRIMRWQLSGVRQAIKEMLDKPGIPSNIYGDGNAGLNIALKIGEIANAI